MNKQVSIPVKPSRETNRGDWVDTRKLPIVEKRTKRVTLDIDLELHRRIRLRCFEEDVTMTDRLNEIIAEHFPEPVKPETADN